MIGISNEFFSRFLNFFQLNLIPIMVGVFVVALFLKAGSFLTLKFLQSFVNHIEVTVMDLIHDKRGIKNKIPKGFHNLAEFIFNKAFDEHYTYKHKYQRRRLDRLTTITDRLFLITEGSIKFIKDALNYTKYFDKYENRPEFNETTNYLVLSNPVYKRVFGIFPLEMVSEIVTILPNIFVVMGIFGTFIGIMTALPELGAIDVTNLEKTKAVMDGFLRNIAFSMNTSIIGIIFSISMNFLNAFFSSDVILEKINETLNNSFSLMWNESHSKVEKTHKEVILKSG